MWHDSLCDYTLFQGQCERNDQHSHQPFKFLNNTQSDYNKTYVNLRARI